MSRYRALTRVRCSSSRQTSIQQVRPYHSYEHDLPSPLSPAENAILAAGISHVPTHGFTTTALINGARDAGYIDVSANLFPSGAFSLVKYHLVTQRLALAQNRTSSTTREPTEHRTGEPTNVLHNVRALTLKRLRANEIIIHRWQEALALLAMPKHIPDSLRELALLSDEIHFLAGDKSVDTSWYTKRAGLSAIYASTELFMTQDQSANFKETEDFLDRRLEAAQGLKSMIGDTGKWAGVQAMSLVSGLRSKGLRI
ncbi:MAG: hypothetical protein LQ341_001698 [Variospora aurantia]|nr:MAG: hypothetical protein LQ341_001698 [Variospora aurantia]